MLGGHLEGIGSYLYIGVYLLAFFTYSIARCKGFFNRQVVRNKQLFFVDKREIKQFIQKGLYKR